MNELWVARDGDGSIGVFEHEPQWFDDEWISETAGDYIGSLLRRGFPDLKPGECRRLVMESEVSE